MWFKTHLLFSEGTLNATASHADVFQGKKCNGQVSFFNISTTAGLCLNLELIFIGSLLKQPEDHDRRIFQSYCLQSQLCPAGLATLIFKLLFQAWTELCPPLQVSKTDNSKIMPSFCLGKTALSSSSNPINGSLTIVYISNSKCRKKREKKEKEKKRDKEKIFQGQNIVFNFFMNNAMAAVQQCAFCPHHGFSIIRILKVSFHLSPTFIGRYLTI